MEISIAEPSKRFSEHLTQPMNSRILFSGKFGTGKSHFLRHYFEDNKIDYNLFWISPIHYVIGANQDIFEWIKVDIAKQLLIFLPQDTDNKISHSFLLQSYIYQKRSSIFIRLLTYITGKASETLSGVNVAEALKKDVDDIENYKQELTSEQELHFKKLSNFIENNLTIRGSIYEDDLRTITAIAKPSTVSNST